MTPFESSILLLVALLSLGLAYFGASVGLVLGQLRLPVLVYWLGSPIVGAGTSLAISAVAALVGAVGHARAGRVSLRLIASIGAPSALAAFVAARHAAELDPALVKAAIGLALLVTAAFMLIPGPAKPDEQPGSDAADPPRSRLVAEVAVGTVLGAVAGLVGLLMGTLRLPIMLRMGAEPARAIGSNLAIGCGTGLSAGVATAAAGNIDWLAFAVITPTTMLGAYLGARATGRMDQRALRQLIALALLGIGGWMVWEWAAGLGAFR